MAALGPAPCPRRSDPCLQPSYFTSSLYVDPLRADLRTLASDFQIQYAANTAQSPFVLFKNRWAHHGWDWLHFKVLDDRGREAFLKVTCRIFLELVTANELVLAQVTALFALYTFFFTQPSNTTPRMWKINAIPLPIDHCIYLYTLPDQLQPRALRPILTAVLFILDNFTKNQVFLILPKSTSLPMSPGSLPREVYARQESVASVAPQPKKRGRPSKNDKAKHLKAGLHDLESWIDKTGQPPLTLDTDEYTQNKAALLGHLGNSSGGRSVIDTANSLVLNRLNEIQSLASDDDSLRPPPDDAAGIRRVMTSLQELKDGHNKGIFNLMDGSGKVRK